MSVRLTALLEKALGHSESETFGEHGRYLSGNNSANVRFEPIHTELCLLGMEQHFAKRC